MHVSSFFISLLISVRSTFAMVGSPSYFKEQSNRKMSKIPDPSDTLTSHSVVWSQSIQMSFIVY